MEDYKERLIAEYAYIKDKYIRLYNFIVKYEAGTLVQTPASSISLLKEQLETMRKYLYILEVRAEIEGIGVENLQK